MADILKSVTTAFAATRDTRIRYNIAQRGASSLLTGIYNTTDDETAGFYRKPDITGDGESTKLAVIYGEVMITPYLVDAGVESSTNDAGSILKTYRFITGDGVNSGPVTGPNGSPLENIYIKDPNGVPQPVVNSDGRPSLGNVILASALGGAISSAPKIWDAIKGAAPAAAKTSTVDPVTGKPIPSAAQQQATALAKQIPLGNLTNVDETGKGDNFVLSYDANKGIWVPKSIGPLLGDNLSSSTICGGDGGTGGTGGSGGTDPSYSNSFTTTSTQYEYTLDLTKFLELADIECGYIDDNGTSVSLGIIYPDQYAPTGQLDFTVIAAIVKARLSAALKTNNITVAVSATRTYAIVTATTPTFSSNNQCTTTEYLQVWFKHSGTTISTVNTSPSSCGPCYVKSTTLQIRDAKAASTADITGGALSSVTNTVTIPSIRAYFENPTRGATSNPVRYYLTRFGIETAGANIYKPPLINYTPSSTTGTGTYSEFANISGGGIASLNIDQTRLVFKDVTLPATSLASGYQDIVYNGSRYVAIGPKAAVSTDGNTWTTYNTSSPTSTAFKAIAWNGTTFCVIRDGTFGTSDTGATSTDGTSWTLRTLPTTGTTNFTTSIAGISTTINGWQDIASNGSIFCAVGSTNGAGTGCATSPDGVTWTSRTISATNIAWTNIIWNGSQFCALGIVVSNGSTVSATSSDGITWNSYISGATNAGGGLAYGLGKYVASRGVSVSYSTDGLTWTSVSLSGVQPMVVKSLAFDGTKFVGVGPVNGSGSVRSIYSLDATTWLNGTQVSGASTGEMASVIWDGTAFRGLSNQSGFTTISRDGISFGPWNNFDAPASTNELIPNGFGYDYTTSTQFFSVPNTKKRLTFSSALSSLDGQTINDGDIILLKDQTNKVENGVYQRVSSTVFDQLYELNSYEFTQNGQWVHITNGVVNANTDWMLNSATITVYQQTDPQTWQNVTASDPCDITPGSGGTSGSPGAPGTDGTCTTITTTPKPQPTILLAGPCARQYGTQTTPPAFDPVTLPSLTLTTGIASTTCTVLYTVTTGDAQFQLASSIPGTVTSVIGTRTISLTGPVADVQTASAQVQIRPANSSKGELNYTVTITNADGTAAGTGCSVVSTQIVIENSQAASAKFCIDPATTTGSGRVMVTFNERTLDLTDGFIPFNTNVATTATDMVLAISANVATKNALDPTDPYWLPAFTAQVTGTGEITVSAPAAGGADFNGVQITPEATGGFIFGDCPGTMVGGVTKTINDFLKNNVPNWDKVSNVLLGIGGNVLGAVLTNVIMNGVGQTQISVPTEEDVELAFLYRGRVIQVPDEYDGLARTGHPTSYDTWSGVWKQAYTNNPAWVVYDFITNRKYGLGKDISLTTAQQTALLRDIFSIGYYCDDVINSKPRFSVNTVITEGTKMEILRQLTSVFFGGYVFNNGGLRIVIDRQDTTAKLLVTNANCSNIENTYSNGRNFVNKVRLSYVEPSNFYTENVVVAEVPDAIDTYGERAVDLVAFGCTDVDQALRYATQILNTENDTSLTISYQAGADHYNLMPGDLIRFWDRAESGISRGGRIISQSGTTVVLDRAPNLSAGNYIHLTCSDGSIHSTTVVSVSGSTVTMTDAPAVAANPYQVWTGSLTLKDTLFKVIKIEETSNSVYNVTIQHYNSDKY